MKAVLIQRHGGPEVLQLGDLPNPSAGAGEVVVDMHAASVNAVDCDIRRGQYGADVAFPYVLGRDLAGTVSSVGAGVEHLIPGDRVFAVTAAGKDGAYAEKISIDASIVSKLPVEISFVEGAAIALAGLTAMVSIEETLDMQPGERVLVHGGAGGVGSMAVQLAKRRGARVIATAREAHRQYLEALGVDEFIDYQTGDFAKIVSNCDAVFSPIGGEAALRSFEVLRPGGRAAFIASGPTAPTPARSDVSSLRPAVNRDRHRLKRLAAMVADREIQPPAITEFNLLQAPEAHAALDAGGRAGKLVLRVRY
jgi:NADPH:quinone reductase-like Zn-dependent oxidoreductase